MIENEIKFTSKNKGISFTVTTGRTKDNFFKTNLIFDLKMHPFASLFAYAHELFHWCREKHHLELIINNPLKLEDEVEVEDEIEEVLAKKMEIDLFSYISEIEPAIYMRGSRARHYFI